MSAAVHAALEAAGYRNYGINYPYASVLWQRKERGFVLDVNEWPAVQLGLPDARYELDAYEHDERDARRVKLYSFAPAEFAQRLPELERRALAAMRALRAGPPVCPDCGGGRSRPCECPTPERAA